MHRRFIALLVLVIVTSAAHAQIENASGQDLPICHDSVVQTDTCRNTIRFGVRTDYPRFSVRSPMGDFEGFEPALALTLARRLNLGVEFVSVLPQERIAALAEGRVDVIIATMGHTSQRDSAATFLPSHYFESQTAIAASRDLPIRSWNDLQSLRVCSTVGNYANGFVGSQAQRLELYRNGAQLQAALMSGECPVVAHDNSLLDGWLQAPHLALKYEKKLEVLPVPWGIALPKDADPALVDALNSTLEQLHRDGVLVELSEATGIRSAFLSEKQSKWRTPECIDDPQSCHDGPLGDQARVQVHLPMGHRPRYAGFYLANVSGIYGDAGIAADLVEGDQSENPFHALTDGSADVVVGWIEAAAMYRAQGHDVVNIGQFLGGSGALLVCRRDAGIAGRSDLIGKRIATWQTGDYSALLLWLRSNGVGPNTMNMLPKGAHHSDLLERRADCVTSVSRLEYQQILQSGLSADALISFHLDNHYEDGLYVASDSLHDPQKRVVLAQFLAATAEGWRMVRSQPEEALAISRMLSPTLTVAELRTNLEVTLGQLASDETLGLLDISDLPVLRGDLNDLTSVGGEYADLDHPQTLNGLWTHDLWYEAGLGEDAVFQPREATMTYFSAAADTRLFYLFDLIGTVAFGLAGFMRAKERQFDLWGAMILTMLPAVGGGTLRDLLVGGDRHPPFIFNDPTYIYLVLGTVVVGVIGSWVAAKLPPNRRAFDRILLFADTLGLATFTVIGAKVALTSGLDWIWVPFCAALTCAGGGMLMDIVTGREPRTFKGEPYEEIAIFGSLLMLGLLEIADRFEQVAWSATAAIVVTVIAVMALRFAVVHYGWRSPRLRNRRAGLG